MAEDWASLLTSASQPGSSLEQLHIFVLAHVLRRPIVVYGVKYVKSWRGENLGYARFEGKIEYKIRSVFFLRLYISSIVTLKGNYAYLCISVPSV